MFGRLTEQKYWLLKGLNNFFYHASHFDSCYSCCKVNEFNVVPYLVCIFIQCTVFRLLCPRCSVLGIHFLTCITYGLFIQLFSIWAPCSLVYPIWGIYIKVYRIWLFFRFNMFGLLSLDVPYVVFFSRIIVFWIRFPMYIELGQYFINAPYIICFFQRRTNFYVFP